MLNKFDVEMIGARAEAIDKAEDREMFKEAMTRIGLGSARSGIAHNLDEALEVQADHRLPGDHPARRSRWAAPAAASPTTRRSSSSMCKRGLEASPTREVLIEESLIGWKEFELEVMRDKKDNCVIVCSIENVDPMGVHTGDSITVAPAQTLTDKEYQLMRDASIAVMREIGVDTGGSNVQFAVNPDDGRMVVIEMNPRVSRSSALASKATGFPIAKIAAKLAVGYTLDELANDITRRDAGVLRADDRLRRDQDAALRVREVPGRPTTALTTQMKSVGEVMSDRPDVQGVAAEGVARARGRRRRLQDLQEAVDPDKIADELAVSPRRARSGTSPTRSASACRSTRSTSSRKIDPWFLAQIEEIVDDGIAASSSAALAGLSRDELRGASGSASRTADSRTCSKTTEAEVRARRHALGMPPGVQAGGHLRRGVRGRTRRTSTRPTRTSARRAPTDRKKVIILGGGPNRIGQGIEFDYCCVHAALALREDGLRDDHGQLQPGDRLDRLRHVRPALLRAADAGGRAGDRPSGEAVRRDRPVRRPDAAEARARTWRRTACRSSAPRPDSIDMAEDRERFQQMLHRLHLKQPPNRTARTEAAALVAADEIGYPLVVRPSYVLGGRAMEIVYEQRDLERYMREAVKVSNDSPVLLDRFLDDAIEVDVDALADGDDVVIGGIMEHIEQAGVHSGDSACSLPPFSLSAAHAGRSARADRGDGARPQCRRTDERPVRDPARRARRRRRVRPRSESARLAHGAVRLEGDRPAARQDRRALHGRAARCANRVSQARSCRRIFRSRKRCSRSSSSPASTPSSGRR